MGPPPRTGNLLSVDIKGRRLVYYDAAQQNLRTLVWRLVEEQSGVFPDDPRLSGGAVPSVNAAAGSVTLYSPHDRKLIEIAVAAEDIGLPPETWCAGDDVRYYYKDPRQALRLMNVSRTDLSKGGH